MIIVAQLRRGTEELKYCVIILLSVIEFAGEISVVYSNSSIKVIQTLLMQAKKAYLRYGVMPIFSMIFGT